MYQITLNEEQFDYLYRSLSARYDKLFIEVNMAYGKHQQELRQELISLEEVLLKLANGEVER